MTLPRQQQAELELIEQQVTLALQEIDAEFVRGREIAGDILGQARKYVQHVKDLHDSIMIWNQFFDLMNVNEPTNYTRGISHSTQNSNSKNQARRHISTSTPSFGTSHPQATYNSNQSSEGIEVGNYRNGSGHLYDSNRESVGSGVASGNSQEESCSGEYSDDAGIEMHKPKEELHCQPRHLQNYSPNITTFDSPLRTTRVFGTPFALTKQLPRSGGQTLTMNSLSLCDTLDMDQDDDDENASDNVTTIMPTYRTNMFKNSTNTLAAKATSAPSASVINSSGLTKTRSSAEVSPSEIGKHVDYVNQSKREDDNDSSNLEARQASEHTAQRAFLSPHQLQTYIGVDTAMMISDSDEESNGSPLCSPTRTISMMPTPRKVHSLLFKEKENESASANTGMRMSTDGNRGGKRALGEAVQYTNAQEYTSTPKSLELPVSPPSHSSNVATQIRAEKTVTTAITATESPLYHDDERSEEGTGELDTPSFIKHNPRIDRYGGRTSMGVGVKPGTRPQPPTQSVVKSSATAREMGVCAMNEDQADAEIEDGSDGSDEYEFDLSSFPPLYQRGNNCEELQHVWGVFWADNENAEARTWTVDALRREFPKYSAENIRIILDMLQARKLVGRIQQGEMEAFHLQ
eukprot:CFRG3732T1